MEKKTKSAQKKEDKYEMEKFIDNFVPAFSENALNTIYQNEIKNFNKVVREMAKRYKRDDEEEVTKKDIEEMKKKLTPKEYEQLFANTVAYVKSRIWHGYDSKYYVCTYDQFGCFFPREYTVCDFGSTFLKYFPIQIHKWFEQYSEKFILSVDNEKPRSYVKDECNFLNLFSGFKHSKLDNKDVKRVQKGKAGVEFILNHIKEIFCSNNEQIFMYVNKWIMKLVCGFKLKTMLYFKSKMGRGKGKITKFIMDILGTKVCVPLNNDRCFTGEFNGSLMAKSFCLLDEICHNFEDFKSLYNQLKPYITEDLMSYRNLYEKLKTLKNITSFMMTGNYDMLKLDDPSKGEDRRILISDVADIIKDEKYCKKLDAYCENEDVQYAFFWYCIENMDKDFNELHELKKMPVTETKKAMIQQSLDTSILFLKSIVNNPIINTHNKPKEFYNEYTNWCRGENIEKRKMSPSTFLSKLKELKEFVTFHDNLRLDGKNPTNYVTVNRAKMIEYFTAKHYWCEYDDINEKVSDVDEIENDPYDQGVDKTDKSVVVAVPMIAKSHYEAEIEKLKKEITTLKQQLEVKDEIKQIEKQFDDKWLKGFRLIETMSEHFAKKKTTKKIEHTTKCVVKEVNIDEDLEEIFEMMF